MFNLFLLELEAQPWPNHKDVENEKLSSVHSKKSSTKTQSGWWFQYVFSMHVKKMRVKFQKDPKFRKRRVLKESSTKSPSSFQPKDSFNEKESSDVPPTTGSRNTKAQYFRCAASSMAQAIFRTELSWKQAALGQQLHWNT